MTRTGECVRRRQLEIVADGLSQQDLRHPSFDQRLLAKRVDVRPRTEAATHSTAVRSHRNPLKRRDSARKNVFGKRKPDSGRPIASAAHFIAHFPRLIIFRNSLKPAR
jgi:hypothetical protein